MNPTQPEPKLPIQADGIYAKCVYDGTEIYAPAVIDYSKGKAVPTCCNRPLPKEYVKLAQPEGGKL